MDQFKQKLKNSGFSGDLDDSPTAKEFYSHDASLFEVRPELVVMPKNADDVAKLVTLVASEKTTNPTLSLTARSAGTCMSGGAINDSVIVDFNKYFKTIENITPSTAQAQPGVFYRDFEIETFKQHALMPSFPASRDLCTIGGMVNNNSGGEKSLEYGKTENFVTQLKVVFADGVERVVKPLNKDELERVCAQADFEGQVYSKLKKLIEDNYDKIKAAKPNVTKNSTGYNLWDVWDKETGIFDLTKLIVGSQGTLALTTDIWFKLVPKRDHSGLLVLFLRDIDSLGEIIPLVMESKPATFESFDDATFKLAIRFMPSFLKTLGWKRFIHLLFSLIPDGLEIILPGGQKLFRGIPKLILMIEYNGDSEDEVRQKVHAMHQKLKKHKARYEINGFEEDATEGKSEKFWVMRRQSFNLLRSKVKDKHTAPFIDDLVVNPPHLTDFLPKLRLIIKKYNLLATIAGHMGDGNFHIIPLMKLEEPSERAKLLPAMKEVNDLVLSYHGSLSGEHNDGMIRGPWLEVMYGPEVLDLFKQAKSIMDPQDIFNPHKKTDSDWDYSFNHIRSHF